MGRIDDNPASSLQDHRGDADDPAVNARGQGRAGARLRRRRDPPDRAIPELAALAPAIRAEHERWDGTGYPDGLAGHQIPFPATAARALVAGGKIRR
jgi:hypothetical protein